MVERGPEEPCVGSSILSRGTFIAMTWYTYILKCADDTLYTGYTNDLNNRLEAHASGSAKYTRGRLPVELMYSEQSETRSEAMKREYAIKQLSREEKMSLMRK